MDSSSSTTVTIIDHVPIAASSGLSGELSCENYAAVVLLLTRLCFIHSW